MRVPSKLGIGLLAVGSIVMASAMPALAKCQRMGFLVNDYGKDGPTKDAQDLLDKHIEKWAADNGVEKYTVGKKDVACELYLNLILFDEHTCTATANVCWGEETPAAAPQEAKAKSEEKSVDKTAKSDATKAKPATAADKSDKKSDATVVNSGEKEAAVETGAIPTAAPVAQPTTETVVIAPPEKPAPTAPASSVAVTNPPVDSDPASKAAAAAERAAAAAERAAKAAERAAAAAAKSEKAAAGKSTAQESETATATATPQPSITTSPSGATTTVPASPSASVVPPLSQN